VKAKEAIDAHCGFGFVTEPGDVFCPVCFKPVPVGVCLTAPSGFGDHDEVCSPACAIEALIQAKIITARKKPASLRAENRPFPTEENDVA